MTLNLSATHSFISSMSKIIPKVSIVVCHHTGDLIYPFIDSIKKHCTLSYELIIVSSNEELCTNGIEGCQTFFSTELPATKRNIGVRVSKSPNIAFFDDDTEIEPGCVEEMYKSLVKENVGMVYGKLHKYGTSRFDEAGGFITWTGFIWSRAEQNIQDVGQYDKEEPIFSGKSASCMIRKYVFCEVGEFDESFGILGEETDLAWRVWLKGYSVIYCPSSLTYHKFNTPLKPANKYYTSDRVHFNGCRNYLTMLIKNLGESHLWIVPLHASIWLGVGVAMLVTGKFRQGVNILRGLSYIVSHLREILTKRRIIQSTRSVDDKELWKTIYRLPSRGYFWTRVSRYLRIGLHG